MNFCSGWAFLPMWPHWRKGLIRNKNLLNLEYTSGKKKFFSTGLQKKITYFIVILKTLDAIALLELSESVVKSRFLEENPASAVYCYENNLIVENIDYFMHVKQNYLKFRSDGKFHGKLWAESYARLDNSIEVWVAW